MMSFSHIFSVIMGTFLLLFLVAILIIYFVLHIYKMTLTLLSNIIFAAARFLLPNCLLEIMLSIETNLTS